MHIFLSTCAWVAGALALEGRGEGGETVFFLFSPFRTITYMTSGQSRNCLARRPKYFMEGKLRSAQRLPNIELLGNDFDNSDEN